MGTNLAVDSMVTEASLAYIRRQASGGAGLIIMEITAVHPSGCLGGGHLGAFDDRFIPGLRKMAEAIHEGGGKASMQLHHAGRENLELLKKGKAVGPSAVPSLVYGMAPKEMSREMIHEIVEAFGKAAARAKKAGFDAVEVHGAHGYLLTQFLSGLSNHREDEYGGPFSNRARFVLEVLESVRSSVGEDFPVGLRLSAEESIKNGYTVEDMKTILPDLVRAGADIIHASIGTHGSPGGITSASPEYEAGFNAWRARALKEVVDVPVIAVGRFTDPALADQVIARGDADLVAFGRQQLADPDFLIKAREGRMQDIRKCIACNQGCIERLMLEPEKSVRCAINPETGQELLYPRKPAGTSRNVWIVGAGPAGLTAAYEAKRLGHDVSLFEKEERPGGNLFYASRAPFKEVYWEWMLWLISQVEKAGVRIQTQTTVTDRMLEEGNPEVVILATGGEKIVPPIPGLALPFVCDAWQILDERVEPKENAVVVGGGLIGMEAADYMADKGSKVTLVELLENSPVQKFTSHGYMLHRRLRDHQCRLLFGTELTSIQKNAVTVTRQGREEILPNVEQVVLAVGMKPRHDLKETLKRKAISHFVVGDAAGVRRIIEATEEGARAAWDL